MADATKSDKAQGQQKSGGPKGNKPQAAGQKPKGGKGGQSAFPQLRAVMLVGVFTHFVADVVFGPFTLSEQRITDHLVSRLKPGVLILMDRAFYGLYWAVTLQRRDVQFAIRMKLGKTFAANAAPL